MTLVEQHDALGLACPDSCPCWIEEGTGADTLSRAQSVAQQGAAYSEPIVATPHVQDTAFTCARCNGPATPERGMRRDSKGRATCFDCLADATR